MEYQESHGGNIYGKNIRLDYSANLNPFHMPERVKKAIIDGIEEYYRYPDPDCKELILAIATAKGLLPEWIVCGNGAADLIYRYALSIKANKVLLLAPTFSEYEQAFRLAGTEICYYLLKEKHNFSVGEDILKEIPLVDGVVLCNPNNPVGNLIEPGLLQKIGKAIEEEGKFLFLDECFMEFTKYEKKYSSIPYIPMNKRIFVLKAFTKIYAMAGIRLGYGICSDMALLGKVKSAGAPWSVSGVAQKAGIAALKEIEYVKQAKEIIEEEREFLKKGLGKLGLFVYPSQANYIMFKAEEQLYEQLLGRGILIRQCGNYYGLGNEYYRVCIGKRRENQVLLEEIGFVIDKQEG